MTQAEQQQATEELYAAISNAPPTDEELDEMFNSMVITSLAIEAASKANEEDIPNLPRGFCQ